MWFKCSYHGIFVKGQFWRDVKHDIKTENMKATGVEDLKLLWRCTSWQIDAFKVQCSQGEIKSLFFFYWGCGGQIPGKKKLVRNRSHHLHYGTLPVCPESAGWHMDLLRGQSLHDKRSQYLYCGFFWVCPIFSILEFGHPMWEARDKCT